MNAFFLSHCFFLSQHYEEFIFLFFVSEFRKEIGLVNDAAFWIWLANYGPHRPPIGGPKMRSPAVHPFFPLSIFSILFILIYLLVFLILNFEFDFNSFEFSCLNLFKLKEKFETFSLVAGSNSFPSAHLH